jgi:hypothetical protein
MCKLPAQNVWIEYSMRDRLDWLEAAAARGVMSYEAPTRPKEGSVIAKRVGYLLSETNLGGERVIRVINAGLLPDDEAFLDPRDFGIGFEHASDAHVQSWIGVAQEAVERAPKNIRGRMRPPGELEALARLMCSLRLTSIDSSLEKSPALSDLKFIISLLALINSRNLIRVGEPVDNVTLNRRREKRGKPKLLTHQPILLNLSRVQRRRIETRADEHDGQKWPVAPQFVLGHFKVRKTGIF